MKTFIDKKIRDIFLEQNLTKKNFNCLEIGSDNFSQTKILAKYYNKIYCVDKKFYSGSRTSTNIFKKKIVFTKKKFENYLIPDDVKHIFLIATIEHLNNPTLALNMILSHLKKKKGTFFLFFNNKYSLHRILGQLLGKIKNLDHLTPDEKTHGHNFIFDETYFDKIFLKKKWGDGVKMIKKYIFFKPLPTRKMKFACNKKNFKKLIYPKILKKNCGYIFYKLIFK